MRSASAGALDHPATHHAVVDELRKRFPADWPYLLGVLFAHREACLLAALRALDRALGRPKVTRAGARGAKRVQFRLKLRLL